MMTGAMLQSANKAAPPFVMIGNPAHQGNPRVAHFQGTLAALSLAPAKVVPYAELLTGSMSLADVLSPGCIVRIDSPGRNFDVERALLALGADREDTEGEYERLSPQRVAALTFEKGRILPSRQWYLGYCALLRQIEGQLDGYQLMNPPRDIEVMFDKRLCHARLERAGIPLPPAFAPIACYDELIARMHAHNCYRVFVKLAHGSSASGVVAYRLNGQRHQAITTVEMVHADGELRLYNSRHIRVYEDRAEIKRLIDALCRERVHVEAWLPKAGHAGRTFDLRVMVIAGEVRHVVVRLSRSPMTNLHLLNTRGDVQEILEKLNLTPWQQTCEQAVAQFDSLYTGIDLMFTPDYRHHAILEMNAFGDLLPGLLHNGEDTYTAEIKAILGRVTL